MESINSKVLNGKLISNRKRLSAEIARHEGKEIEITIKRKYKRRSLQENKYYWGVVVDMWKRLISEEWGESLSSDEVHEILKLHCNYQEKVIESTGEVIKIAKSTADLKTLEFEDYLERCRRKAFEFFNAVIPLPNEMLRIEF